MSEDQRPPDDSDPTRLDSNDLEGGADDTTRAGGEKQDDSSPEKCLGDFELLRELGRGGMGIVYEARQISLDRRVALKVLPPAVGLTGHAKQRFEREARAAAKLHHTNIVPVHAIGEQDGHHFYAMDLIEGQSLDCVLRELIDDGANPLMEATVTRALDEIHPRPSTPSQQQEEIKLSDTSAGGREWFDTAAKLIAEVADGLHYAHGRGVIHRDIKPANLMLSKEGHLCVTDFGLARVAQEPGMTASGSFLGTPAYMSPEQIAAGRMKLDHRTDVYSLGAVLYELLALRRPFPGESREEILGAILTKDPRPPRRFNKRIPVDLETICLKALEKDPDRRYRTAGELAQDLRQYLQRGLIAARRAGIARRTWKSIRRHPLAAVSVAAAVLIVVVGGLAWRASMKQAAESAWRAVADARLAMATGEHLGALERANEALGVDPDLVDARLIRVQALIKLDRTDEAVSEAEGLIEKKPDDWRAHLILAGLAKGAETAGEIPTISAREHVEFVESRAPETADALYLRSLIAETPTESVELLDRALDLSPGHAQAIIERIRLRVWLVDFPAALQDCERLIAASPGSPQGLRAKSWVLGESGDFLGALAEADKAVRLDPEDPINYETRARANGALGRHRETIEDLTRALELNPDHPMYYSRRAQFHFSMGHYDSAVADARRALELNPNYLVAFKVLLHAQFLLDQQAEVRQVLSELAAVAESWADLEARSWAHVLIARFHALLGDRETALAEVTHVLETDPGNLVALFLRVDLRRSLGDGPGVQADCDAAARVLTDLLTDLDRNPRVGTMGWDLGTHCGRWDLALETDDRTIEEFPNWDAPYIGRCGINTMRGRLEAALADCSKAIELSPKHFNGYQNRSAVYERMRRLKEATDDAGMAVECHPYHPTLRYNYAWFLFSAGRAEAALAQIDKAIDLDPKDVSAHAERARELACLGRCEEAVEALRHADQLVSEEAAELLRGGSGQPPATSTANIAESRLHAALCGCEEALDREKVLDRAQLVAEQFPGDSRYLTIHGFALYRNGQYEEASRSLSRAVEAAGQESSHELFLLAMAAHRLGDLEQARSNFDRAVTWMDRYEPANPVLVNLRREAAELLDVQP